MLVSRRVIKLNHAHTGPFHKQPDWTPRVKVLNPSNQSLPSSNHRMHGEFLNKWLIQKKHFVVSYQPMFLRLLSSQFKKKTSKSHLVSFQSCEKKACLISSSLIPPRSLTARPWKMMGLEDDRLSFWVSVYFQGLLLLNSQGVNGYKWVFPKNNGKTPQIIHFNRVFHDFHHPFWEGIHWSTPNRIPMDRPTEFMDANHP